MRGIFSTAHSFFFLCWFVLLYFLCTCRDLSFSYTRTHIQLYSRREEKWWVEQRVLLLLLLGCWLDQTLFVFALIEAFLSHKCKCNTIGFRFLVIVIVFDLVLACLSFKHLHTMRVCLKRISVEVETDWASETSLVRETRTYKWAKKIDFCAGLSSSNTNTNTHTAASETVWRDGCLWQQ